MNLLKDKYIILEIIPTHSDKRKGTIAPRCLPLFRAIKLERIAFTLEEGGFI